MAFKKKYLNDEDDASYDMLGGGVPDTYRQLGVAEIRVTVNNQARSIMKALSALYLKNGDGESAELIRDMMDAESINLATLLMQVRFISHAMDTLMQGLDDSGRLDRDLCRSIIEMQESAINITMQVSSYVRNLPAYIRQVASDMGAPGGIPLPYSDEAYQNALPSPHTAIPLQPMGADENFIRLPQRGVRDLLKAAHRERFNDSSNAEAAQENI